MPPPWLLPVIVISLFAGTSLWFSGNAILPDLATHWRLPPQVTGYVTSSVQLGFIAGTLIFATLGLADRFSPRRVFFSCTLLGALSTAVMLVLPAHLISLLSCRFLTGIFLAGIYPVGMKIAFGWFQQKMGMALGFVLGALVLGTAFPHLLKGLGQTLPWEFVVAGTSLVALSGGLLMLLLVPDGPFLGQAAAFNFRALFAIFRQAQFRASSFGYFGHMWELYAFWAFVPLILEKYAAAHALPLNVPIWSFSVIASGFIGCALGGLVALRMGSARVAFVQLATSGGCCLLSPLLFSTPPYLFFPFLFLWGITVVGDSPQFSALNAQMAPREMVGSALTIVNCIGFAITILTIQLVDWLASVISVRFIFLPLLIGPLTGLIALKPLLVRLTGKPTDSTKKPRA